MTFHVTIGDERYPLVRDPAHIHPPAVHAHLGTDSEKGLRRLLEKLAAAKTTVAPVHLIDQRPTNVCLRQNKAQRLNS